MHSSELQRLPSLPKGHLFLTCTLRAGSRQHSLAHPFFPSSDPILPSLDLSRTLGLLPGVQTFCMLRLPASLQVSVSTCSSR